MKKKVLFVSLFLLFFCCLSSCRYATPIVKFKEETYTIAFQQELRTINVYKYPRFSRNGFWGIYEENEYFSNNKLDSVRTTNRSTNKPVAWGYVIWKEKTKVINNDTTLNLGKQKFERVHYSYTKNELRFIEKTKEKIVYYEGANKRKIVVKKQKRYGKSVYKEIHR